MTQISNETLNKPEVETLKKSEEILGSGVDTDLEEERFYDESDKKKNENLLPAFKVNQELDKRPQKLLNELERSRKENKKLNVSFLSKTFLFTLILPNFNLLKIITYFINFISDHWI